MKKVILSLVLVSLLISCVEVKFEEPQPKGVKPLEVIPESIRGTYIMGENDTMKISADGFVLLNDSSKKDEVHELSEFFVIKKWRKSYFINIREKDEESWSVIFITRNKEKRMTVGILSFNNKELDEIEKIKKITEVEEIKNSEGEIVEYRINPSKRELKKIMKTSSFLELGGMTKLN